MQTYTVSGALQGFFGVDYRILVEGPCGEPPGAFNEEWQGLTGELTVRGNLGDDGLSYVGSIAPEEHQQPTSVRLLHQRYMTASLRHDLATRRLTREDAVWQLGPRTFRGRDEVLGPNEYDAGIGNQLQYRNVVARTDPLRRWIRTQHPEALEILVHEPGRLRFSRASGELMARLAREWDEEGAPGRLPPR